METDETVAFVRCIRSVRVATLAVGLSWKIAATTALTPSVMSRLPVAWSLPVVETSAAQTVRANKSGKALIVMMPFRAWDRDWRSGEHRGDGSAAQARKGAARPSDASD